MKNDIESFYKEEEVVETHRIKYSRLTCRKCKIIDEFKGSVDINRLSNGWTALSLDTLQNDKVLDWLLCPQCTYQVKIAAGLTKGE